MSRNLVPTYFLGLSLFGLGIVMAMTLYPSSMLEGFLWRKPLVGSILGSICVMGILAVLFPRACSSAVGFRGRRRPVPSASGKSSGAGKKLTLRGHHPDCGHFSAHVFRVGNHRFCTGCTGLFGGGLAAFIGTIMYFFGDLQVGNSFLLSWIGAVAVASGLILPLLNVSWSSIRLFSNAFFAFGAFLVLVGIDGITQSIFVDLFLVGLIVFWLFTKMVLSRWDHERICNSCEVKACELSGL